MKKMHTCKSLKKIINKPILKAAAICSGISLAVSSISCPIEELFSEEVEAATSFADDASIRDYSRTAVENLVSIGSIKGYPDDNTFKPQGTITRQEFLSMCANACDPGMVKVNQAVKDSKSLVQDGISVYDDTVNFQNLDGLWGKDLIIGARFLGISTAFTDTGKGNIWEQPVTRGEAADIMMYCIEELKGEKFEGNIINDYELDQMIGDWNENLGPQRYSIAQLYALGICHGDSNLRYNPKNNLTREDSAVLIYALNNPDKRDTSKVIKVKKVDPYAGVEIGTLMQTDENRRDAVPGDTFIDANGKSTVVKVGKADVLGEGQPVALDAGRKQKNDSRIVGQYTTSDDTFYRLGATYYINPETGEGHWSDEWKKIGSAYAAEITDPVDGQIYYAGLGNWCKMEHNELGWAFYEVDWM